MKAGHCSVTKVGGDPESCRLCSGAGDWTTSSLVPGVITSDAALNSANERSWSSQVCDTVQMRKPNTIAATVAAPMAIVREASNRVLARITNGSATGNLMSASQLPLSQFGVNSDSATMIASGSRISGTNLSEPLKIAKIMKRLRSDPASPSSTAGSKPKVNGDIRAYTLEARSP